MTFWQRFQNTLDEKKLTVADLSRQIGVAQSSINSWKAKESIPRADIAVKVANSLDTSVEWLISGVHPNNKNQFNVPILNQELSAGKGAILPEDDTIKGFVSLPRWLRQEFGQNIVAMYVKGDSMEPTLHDGDMIVCDSLGWDNGEGIYAIRFNGKGYVKRIQVQPKRILIKSDNPKYQTISEPIESEDYQIIGKVRLVIQAI